MKMFQRKLSVVPLVGLVLILTGCTAGQYDKISEVAPEKSMLRFYGEAQKGLTPKRVAYADPWEYEEYAGFNGNGSRLEVFYLAAAGEEISIEYPYHLHRMVNTWQYNAGKSKIWGEAYHVENPMTQIEYQRYTQNGESCAGFHAGWDSANDDPVRRPGRVIFGYLCNTDKGRLSDASITDTLSNIGIRGVTERIRRNDAQQVAVNFGEKDTASSESRASAMAIARGSSTGANGNRNFPFEFSIVYDELGDGTLND